MPTQKPEGRKARGQEREPPEGAEKRKQRAIAQPEQESSYQGPTGQGNQHGRRQRRGGDQSSKIRTKQGPDTRTVPDNISMR